MLNVQARNKTKQRIKETTKRKKLPRGGRKQLINNKLKKPSITIKNTN